MAENNTKKDKLSELLASGYEFTGRTYKIAIGEHKGKEFPVYALRGDIAGLVYNTEMDKIELVFKLASPYTSGESKTRTILKEIRKTHETHGGNNSHENRG